MIVGSVEFGVARDSDQHNTVSHTIFHLVWRASPPPQKGLAVSFVAVCGSSLNIVSRETCIHRKESSIVCRMVCRGVDPTSHEACCGSLQKDKEEEEAKEPLNEEATADPGFDSVTTR